VRKTTVSPETCTPPLVVAAVLESEPVPNWYPVVWYQSAF
jgi:hypothetical protein